MISANLMLFTSLLLMIYDFRVARIPNWAVFTLLSIGIVRNFPGSLEVWFATVLLVLTGFLSDSMGMGDVKLWIAWFWLIPPSYAMGGLVIGFGTMFLTALVEVVIRRSSAVGHKRPAAWRVFVASLLFIFVPLTGLFNA